MYSNNKIRFYATLLTVLSYLPLNAYACSIQFTSPARGSTVSTASVSVSGNASGFANTGNVGNAVATVNGATFFTYSGTFTTIINFLGSGSATAQLQPGLNVLQVSGSVNGCSASDSMVVFYTPPPPVTQKNAGAPKDPNCTNPVNGATGNKFQTEIDFVGTGPLPLEFKRYYNSAYIESRALGKGWRNNYDRQLTISAGVAYIVRPDGSAFHFTSSGSNWVSDGDINDRLSQVVIGGVSQWQFVQADDSTTEYYDINGRLNSVVNQSGRTLVLGYDGPGRLLAVTDQYTGQKLQFAYDANNRISAMTDPAGNAYTYQYGDNIHLTAVVYPSLVGINQRQYAYGEPAYTSGAILPDALTGISDENGSRYASYTYDAQGRGVITEHANGDHRYSLSYNLDGTTSVTDPLGATRTYSYQTILNVKRKSSQNQPPGAGCSASSSAITYDANGNIATSTDFNGNQTQYTYDLTRNLETKRMEGLSSAGAVTPVTRTINTQWHPDWRLASKVAEPLKLITLVYNGQPDPSNANVLASCAPASALVNSKPIAVLCKQIEQATTDSTGSAGFTATLASSASSTRIWRYSYNNYGQVLTADGPRTDVADTTTYTWYSLTEPDPNKRGHLATLTDALGHLWQYTAYDANGRLLAMTDPNSTVSSYTYTLRGWLNTTTVANLTTTLNYDFAGQLTGATLPDNSSITYVYDAAHRLTDIYDATSHHTHFTLDAAGNRTREEYLNADGSTASEQNRVFDALGRLQANINGAVTQTGSTYSYFANGEFKTAATPKGDTTTQDIDALGRTVKRIDPVNGTSQPTLMGYDAQDQMVSYTAPNGANNGYTVDGLGNTTQEVSADRGTTQATFDAAGNILTRLDARGITTTYSYDALNRRLSSNSPAIGSIPASSLLYSWDTAIGCTHGIGHLCQITDAAGSTVFDYDASDNRISETRTEGGTSFTTIYAYNSANRPIDVISPTAETMAVTLDTAGKVQDISATSAGAVTTAIAQNISYDATGRILSQMLGLSLLNQTFDTAGRLNTQTGIDTTPTGGTGGSGNANDGEAPLPAWALWLLGAGLMGGMRRYQKRADHTLVSLLSVCLLMTSLTVGLMQPELAQATDLTIQYDADGNPSSKTTPAGTTIYTYDALDRINTEAGPAGNRTHSFDANDNRTSNGAGTTATYTANTDRLATINGIAVTLDAVGNITSDDSYRYVWDAYNQLVELHKADYTLIATYYYDYRGLRTRKVTTADAPQGISTTFYHYDQQGHILAETGDATLAQAQTPLMTYVWNGDILTGIIVHQPQRTVLTVQVDQLGSPFEVRTLAGKVVWRWESEAFGNTLPNEDVSGNGNKLTLNLRFPGQYYDKESNLHYNWHRYYSPKLARYLSPDPIGLAGGLNTYSYVENNPLNRIDPLGLAGMAVYFSGYQVDTGMGFSLPLGHAGVVAIDDNTGATQYFDFGRYGGQYGDVRGPYDVGTVAFDKNGFPTQNSLDAIKAVMSQQFGKGNYANTLYNSAADSAKIINFSLDRQKNVAKYPYTLNPFSKNKLNFCDTFAADALKAGTQ